MPTLPVSPASDAPPSLGSLCRSGPLWIGILVTVLNLGAYMLTLSIIFKWIADIKETYVWYTVLGTIATLIEFVGTSFIVWLSEPKRLGRKRAYLVFPITSMMMFAVCIASGGGASGGFTFLFMNVILACVGANNPQGAPYALLCAWLSANTPSSQHVAGFSILLGAQFFAMPVFGMISTLVKPHVGGEIGMFYVAFCFAALQTVVVLLLFPRGGSQSIEDAPTQPMVEAAPAQSRSTFAGDVCTAMKWIFRERFAVTVVWLSIGFVGAADSKDILLYLNKGLGFTEADVNTYMSSMGVYGLVVSFFGVPLISKCCSKGTIIFIGVTATVCHCIVFATVRAPTVLIGMAFFGGLMYGAVPTMLSYMPKENSAGLTQGVLVGTFSGMKTIPSLIGPPVLSACLQAEIDAGNFCYIVPTQSFQGGGFVVMALVMVPAFCASVWLLVRECASRVRERRGQDAGHCREGETPQANLCHEDSWQRGNSPHSEFIPEVSVVKNADDTR